jgi:repressor LexA
MQLSRVREKIVSFIRRYTLQHGYSPSVREIMAHCGFKSPRAVSFHLEKLARSGVLRRDRKARSLTLHDQNQIQMMPIYGMAPGGPAEAPVESQLAAHPAAFPGFGRRGGYALRVRGDSLEQARIFDGDIAIVELRMPRPGDVVVTTVGGETALRKLAAKSKEEIKVLGVVVGVYRKIG